MRLGHGNCLPFSAFLACAVSHPPPPASSLSRMGSWTSHHGGLSLLLLLLSRHALAAGVTPPWGQAGGNAQASGASFWNGPLQGNLKWSAVTGEVIPGFENITRLHSGVRGAVVGIDGHIFFGAADGQIYSVDGTTGALRWTYQTGGRVLQSVALGKTSSPNSGYGVYAVSVRTDYTGGSLLALDSNNGSLIWSFFDASIGQSSAPVVSLAANNFRVYVPGNYLYAFGLWGDLQWTSTVCSYPPPPLYQSLVTPSTCLALGITAFTSSCRRRGR